MPTRQSAPALVSSSVVRRGARERATPDPAAAQRAAERVLARLRADRRASAPTDSELADAAGKLVDALDNGQWPLERQRYEFAREQAAAWLQ